MEKQTRLRLGISTCPNDTYIYEDLIRGLPGSDLDWDVTYADVQTLNERVIRGELDVAKVSCGVLPFILEDYSVLTCGGAMGYGCGPLLLSSSAEPFNPSVPTLLPGKNTTAAHLFHFWASRNKAKPKVEYAVFDELYRKLSRKEAAQGVVIHENRFTWEQDHLHLIEDLGAYWETQTGSPVPLGCAVIRSSLGPELQEKVEHEIRKSLAFANSRGEKITPFIREKAQIKDDKAILSHIEMFVNHFSENIEEEGARSLEILLKTAPKDPKAC
ncbi:MAG: 1,4-dihydroxy-6-naphthoate synthase [Fibrobacter sp.]|jgi:1,4-dihydroxy-6-naphthoate synthase|nr:1,4-dihydroxy-6-naphthoate synthase [Fibrobacter sp.]